MTTPSDLARLHDEISNQSQQLDREEWARLAATLVGCAAGWIFLPTWIVLPLAVISFGADILCSRVLRDVEACVASPRRLANCVALIFVLETAFILPAGLMWHIDDPFAKSLAVGLAASALMHLATVRSIHLPQGLGGAAALSAIVIGSNSTYWIMRGDWQALLVSTVCACASLGYFLMAMVTNHNVHAESAAGHRAAKEAVAAKDRLLATISHELRTPLNGILGMGHAELAGAVTPEARARLSVLVESAEGLSVILDDILDVSAARDGRLAIRPTVGVPAESIAAAVHLFRHGIADRGAAMTLEMAPDLSQPALFDQQRLRQCLSNLLSNALRHGGGAAVRVRAVRSATVDGRQLLDVTVADDGPGVPDALRGLLFEPFTRLHGPLPDGTRQGHGLGLSIARSLARQMGGDLVLEPEDPEQGGASFLLTLELAPTANAAEHAAHQPDPSLAAKRVLVVDDIATNRMVALSCLQPSGVEAVEAASGSAALELLAAGSFDAVFLDMNMPGLDGLATLKRIRALDGPAAQVAVVAMTADAGDSKRMHYLAAGCDGYLAKPITPERADAVLSAVLSARRTGAA